jgi:hypothetical protein
LPKKTASLRDLGKEQFLFPIKRIFRPSPQQLVRHRKNCLSSRAELLRWWEAGRLEPLVAKVFPLPAASQALTTLLSRRHAGKIVLEPGASRRGTGSRGNRGGGFQSVRRATEDALQHGFAGATVKPWR